MIEAVIFDVDGVLVEPMVFAHALDEQYRISINMTSGFFQGPFKACLLGRADLKQAISSYLHDWNWEGSVDSFLQIWLKADSHTNLDMLNFVRELRSAGLKCYVASTQEVCRAGYLEHEMGFGSLFDGLFFSCQLGCEKPAIAFYDMVSSRIGISPGDILFFDDCQANVEGARAAGWNAEMYQFGDDIQALARSYGLGHGMSSGSGIWRSE